MCFFFAIYWCCHPCLNTFWTIPFPLGKNKPFTYTIFSYFYQRQKNIYCFLGHKLVRHNLLVSVTFTKKIKHNSSKHYYTRQAYNIHNLGPYYVVYPSLMRGCEYTYTHVYHIFKSSELHDMGNWCSTNYFVPFLHFFYR